jgi:hypothetical protein
MISSLDGDYTLHPAVERALAAYPGEVARRGAAALRLMLRERLADGDKRAWSSGKLTGDGFPVEFAFTTADERLRYTVEPAGWQDTPQRRLEATIQLLDRLGSPAIDEERLNAWRQAQSRGRLRYGAWLGGRHGTDGDEYKLYIEAPEAGLEQGLPGVYPRPRLLDRTPVVRMLAYTPVSQRYEVYYRIESLAPYHLSRLLAPCGLETHSQELLSCLAGAYEYPLGERLPGAAGGVSYAYCSPDEPHSVTLFFFGRVFWGGDARIRQMFSQCSRALGWDDSCYRQVTAGLAGRRTWTTRHGMLGFTLASDGRLYLSTGIRPTEGIE